MNISIVFENISCVSFETADDEDDVREEEEECEDLGLLLSVVEDRLWLDELVDAVFALSEFFETTLGAGFTSLCCPVCMGGDSFDAPLEDGVGSAIWLNICPTTSKILLSKMADFRLLDKKLCHNNLEKSS